MKNAKLKSSLSKVINVEGCDPSASLRINCRMFNRTTIVQYIKIIHFQVLLLPFFV